MNTLSLDNLPKRKRNDAVGIARVISMFMIVGCHLMSWIGINLLAMILNVGVYIFLIISGILYSTKEISQPWLFIKNRWSKLCIPMYLLVLFLLIYNIVVSEYDAIRSIPIYLTNLQGLGFIVCRLDIPQMNGLEHLWFLTAIMLCYLLLLIVKKIEDHISSKSTAVVAVSIGVFCVLDVVLAYKIKVELHYFIAFFIGYAFGRITKRISLRNYLCLSGAMLCAMAIRLMMRSLFDGTITYNDIVVPFTHIVLAIWIYRTIQYACQITPNFIKSVAQSKVMNWLDGLSLYVYMTHYMFLVGPFYISALPCSKFIQLLVFFSGTLISAWILKVLSQKVIRMIIH